MSLKSWRSFLQSGKSPGPRISLDIPRISLMWPGEIPTYQAKTRPWHEDLGIRALVNTLSLNRRYKPYIFSAFSNLVDDPDVIAWRQAVLTDFLSNPQLLERAEVFLPRIAGLRQGTYLLGKRSRNFLMETSDRLAELEIYTEIVQELHDVLQAANLESPALIQLRDHINTLMQDEHFHDLCEQLPDLREPLRKISSLTIGINLDLQMRPLSAVLLSINDYPLTDKVALLDRVIGLRTDEKQETGLAPLHRLPPDPEVRVYAELFQDLNDLMTQVAQPVARALNHYVRTSSNTLTHLEFELAFFVGASKLINRLRAGGVAFCRPQIAPTDERVVEINELSNLSLLLKNPPDAVPSDVRFDDDGRIAILTGPNSGGKTTYLQSVGLAQVMFQAGMLIPAESARLSPVDDILTHFPRLETREQGRLAEEAGRLREIFQSANRHSLILLNETFSSTAPGEAVYLAQDILCGLRVIGARAIYATHFVDLVEHIDDVHQAVDGDSSLCSLVAGVRLNDAGEAEPTYVITRGDPLGRSYAQEIARRHGISLDQILGSRPD